MKATKLSLPLTEADYATLKIGQKLLLSGIVHTARDGAHLRLTEALGNVVALPFELKNATILYAGPTPAKPGTVCGAIGPTTGGRMDKYTPALLQAGVKVLIGKGERCEEIAQAIRRHHAVYLVAVGGAAALLSESVVSCMVVAYPEMGTEAIHRLVVNDFPCYVAIV